MHALPPTDLPADVGRDEELAELVVLSLPGGVVLAVAVVVHGQLVVRARDADAQLQVARDLLNEQRAHQDRTGTTGRRSLQGLLVGGPTSALMASPSLCGAGRTAVPLGPALSSTTATQVRKTSWFFCRYT